ncbi:hypothetical protein [Alicyclobacillus shizuokensis]|uniref:hypothetical protein n=1 Tax=Alicyclobacillus shizuokensis TaxID=392014 RepID=UPI0008362B47|nr:hypothetical protein [Alicyclobacillus shizuokensis]MCL6626135.1 hypothetical protein [Alicyclobacillus shizuokensis]
MESKFEYLTLSRSDLTRWPTVLSEVRDLVEQGYIKVVDIRRHQDHLLIVFRRLTADLPHVPSPSTKSRP